MTSTLQEMEGPSQWSNQQLLTLAGVAAQHWPAGALYVVATPIGNMADLTLRALWILAHADAIAAEDTRVTRHLLERYQLPLPKHGLIPAHAHNEQSAAQQLQDLLAQNLRVALVTDAGTPAVSDPGARIVAVVRGAGHRVVPLPGPSSVLAALCAAGFTEGGFHFLGFLPSASRERARVLSAAASRPENWIFFEAPHRIAASLQALAKALPPTRRVLVARELTKVHEDIGLFTAAELSAWVKQHDARGEYVVVVEAAAARGAGTLDDTTQRWIQALCRDLPSSRLAAVTAQVTGVPRAEAYAFVERQKSLEL